jgi:hypothetical protein
MAAMTAALVAAAGDARQLQRTSRRPAETGSPAAGRPPRRRNPGARRPIGRALAGYPQPMTDDRLTVPAAVAGGTAGWRDDDLALVQDWGFPLSGGGNGADGAGVPITIWQGDQDRMVP